jgi:hypothetical protein
MVGVSFHFIAEGFGGVHDHFAGQPTPGMFHSHDGDLFVLGELGGGGSSQPVSRFAVIPGLDLVSEPLPSPFHPPKSF